MLSLKLLSKNTCIQGAISRMERAQMGVDADKLVADIYKGKIAGAKDAVSITTPTEGIEVRVLHYGRKGKSIKMSASDIEAKMNFCSARGLSPRTVVAYFEEDGYISVYTKEEFSSGSIGKMTKVGRFKRANFAGVQPDPSPLPELTTGKTPKERISDLIAKTEPIAKDYYKYNEAESIKVLNKFKEELRTIIHENGGIDNFDISLLHRRTESKLSKAFANDVDRDIRMLFDHTGKFFSQDIENQLVWRKVTLVKNDGYGRAFYRDRTQELNVFRGDTRKTYLHEFGHFVEGTTNQGKLSATWRYEKAQDFHLGRSPVKKPLGGRYDPGEVAYTGDFFDKYVGKVYRGDKATEVVSMGLQEFEKDWTLKNLMKKDFDHFAYVYGLISGGFW